ncbi:MAG TPA: PEP-CTERM sorting domain-containing protein [Acetobacteraceae bacterium]|nr:PEP-CTERM sorting domain-containing protein [Acetobacteraceae bacterium]
MTTRPAIAVATALMLAAGIGAAHATVNFTTFVTASDIATVEGGNDATIAFNYAGNQFVGSVYFGNDNNQLYATSLTGGSVQPYGSPIPGFTGEVVVGAGLGQAGFAKGAIYAGNGSGPQIYSVPQSGTPTLFATVPDGGNVRQIFFDPGSGFGGNMLVTTNLGDVYKITSSGSVSLLASIGFDSEGMDIASSADGTYAGDLLVGSEGAAEVHAITPGGAVLLLPLVNAGNSPTDLPEAETVSTVPDNICSAGNPVEGFYVANYPVDIQKAAASQFCGLAGDTIVTGEFSSNSPVWDLHWNGTDFVVTQVGTLPDQSEDGIFVTAQRLSDIGVPEPATLAVLGTSIAFLLGARRRRPS